jgi:hypothetical protein
MSYQQIAGEAPLQGTYVFEKDHPHLEPYDKSNFNIWAEYTSLCHEAQLTEHLGIYNHSDGSYCISADRRYRDQVGFLDFQFNYLSFAYRKGILAEISLDELTMADKDQQNRVPIADFLRIPLTPGTQGNFEIQNFTLEETKLGHYIEERMEKVQFQDLYKIYFKNNRFQRDEYIYRILPTGEVVGQWKPEQHTYQSDNFTLREYLTGPNKGVVAARYQAKHGLIGSLHDKYGNQHNIRLSCGLILETNRNDKRNKKYSMDIKIRGAVPHSLEFKA